MVRAIVGVLADSRRSLEDLSHLLVRRELNIKNPSKEVVKGRLKVFDCGWGQGEELSSIREGWYE